MSDSPCLADFAIGLLNFVFNRPDGPVNFFEEGIAKSILPIKKVFGASETNDVWASNASFSLPGKQAVKLAFFALWSTFLMSSSPPTMLAPAFFATSAASS